MGSRSHEQPTRWILSAYAVLGVLILFVCCIQVSQASFVSRRRAINERLMAQNLDQSKVWRIGVKNMPPMCFYDATLPDNERFSGFYIDFWKQMNDDLLLNYTFYIYNNNIEVINALKNNEIDIGLGLSITWKRALEVDFTQPIVDGSLRIMTKTRSGMNIWELFMPFHWSLWVTILVLAVVTGHIIWLVERDSNSFYFPKFYLSGIREGLWFSFMNLMMMDDAVVRSLPVRNFFFAKNSHFSLSKFDFEKPASIEMISYTDILYGFTGKGKLVKFGSTFTGVILIAIYTATVASLLTTGDINTQITGPQDLIGSKVGSNYGSTAAEYVSSYGGMQLSLFPNGRDAFLALKNGKVPAIILDYPVLVYYSRLYRDTSLTIVDVILEYDLIGLAMRQNSSMIATLNGEIVGLTQTGYSSQLMDKWVGQPKRTSTTSYDIFDTIGLWVWMTFWMVAGLGAFVLKKFVIKKSYKKTSWYASWGGDDKSIKDEEAKDPAEKPLLSVIDSTSDLNQSLATYSESDDEAAGPKAPKLSIQDGSAYEDDVM